MPTIYSTLFSNFIRQGSTFAKSITTHGYAQSVVAATHPHVLNSQNRPVFGRRQTNRLGRFSPFQLHAALHTERTGAGLPAEHRHGQICAHIHGGLDAYYEALQKKQAAGDLDREWTQFEFPKRIEWEPLTPVSAEESAQESGARSLELPATADPQFHEPEPCRSEVASSDGSRPLDAVVSDEVRALESPREAGTDTASAPGRSASLPTTRSHTPATDSWDGHANTLDDAMPSTDGPAEAYHRHIHKLSSAAQYAEIPAVFEAMLAAGLKPSVDAYNALLMAAIHIPVKKIEVVSKALHVYADMMRRQVSPNSETYSVLVGLLASRSLEVTKEKASLEEKRQRYGGMDQPGNFMFQSHELEYAILSEDDRLSLAVSIFDLSIQQGDITYSPESCRQLIVACARAGRITDMLRLCEHMEATGTIPYSAVFPAMITAFASDGDLLRAVECYNEYRNLAVACDAGRTVLQDRLDGQVYAAVIKAYVRSAKTEGAMSFFTKIMNEYGPDAVDLKNTLISRGFIPGFISRTLYEDAFHWALLLEGDLKSQAMGLIVKAAADNDDRAWASKSFSHVAGDQHLVPASMALLAMNIRLGDVASATKYWQFMTQPHICTDSSFIEPTAMYAVALIGSGQTAEGLSQSVLLFNRIRTAESDARPGANQEIEEAVEFIQRFIRTRDAADTREAASQSSDPILPSVTRSPMDSTAPTTPGVDENFDPYAHNTDFRGSALILNELEGHYGRRSNRLTEALHRLRNMRRSGRHPRYITYAKMISAAAREGKMGLCDDLLNMARVDVPLMSQYPFLRFGWITILDAMVSACLTMGNVCSAETYHKELLDMGAAPSANTFGLYITNLKDAGKSFDEATEALRIFHQAKSEGVEPSSFLFNALIGKLGKARRIEDCLFYFSEMRALGIKPTSVTYGTVVNALCRVSDEKLAEELFNEMESMPNYKPRPAPYNSMMQFYLVTKRDRSKALAYYERMRSKRIAPTSHTFKLLIDTHATLEPVNVAAAEQVLDTIRIAGQKPEAVHYASLIHAHGCVRRDMATARALFDQVLGASLVPASAALFQALFEGMVANSQVAQSESLLARMRQSNVELTPYIANTLIQGWGGQGNIGKAHEIYRAVAKEKREPSTFEAMTRAFLAVNQREMAQGVVREMLTRGYPAAVANKILELLGGPPSEAHRASSNAATTP